MDKPWDYNQIVSNKSLFYKTVYTPLSEAISLLEKRQNDSGFVFKVTKLLKGGVPEILNGRKCAIMARQIATPNNENKMFISIAADNNLHPIFIEYFEDKFTSNNKYKHSLGQICIQNKLDKNRSACVEKINIIDFNKYNGKKLNEVKTLWGEPLVDFHKKLFDLHNIKNVSFFNEIEWYDKNQEEAIDFYTNFFILVSCFGILFENFLIQKDDKEGLFTKDVILPALEKAINLVGVKPLIVPIDALDLEVDDFWYHHSSVVKKYINNMLT